MGQHYKAVNLDWQEYMEVWDYSSGSKLMEHAWLSNEFVNAVMAALKPGEPWHGSRVVWAGDYMDEKLFMKGLKGRTRKDKTLYDCCRENGDGPPCITKVCPLPCDGIAATIIVDITRQEFVKLYDLPENDPEDPGWYIHPLPLLTCSGNGRGGGDFHGTNDFVCRWAGDRIEAVLTVPDGMREIVPRFTEADK